MHTCTGTDSFAHPKVINEPNNCISLGFDLAYDVESHIDYKTELISGLTFSS